MINNINTFNAAKTTPIIGRPHQTDSEKILSLMKELSDFQRKHNSLIDILQQQIKILQANIANGITVNETGTVELGLATSTTPGALSASDWGTFNGKQAQSNELDALSALADTIGYIKKTGDGAYVIDMDAESNWRFV